MESQASPPKPRRAPKNSSPSKIESSTTKTVSRKDSPDGAQPLEQMGRVLEATLSSMSDFAYALDLTGRFIYVNQPLSNFLGRTSEGILRKKLADLRLPDELTDRLQKQFEDVVASGKKIADSTQYISRSGRCMSYEYAFMPVMGPRGSVDFVVGTTRDNTIRKLAERDLVKTEARYRGLVEAAPDGMVVVNGIGEIVLLNAQTENQFGFRRDELLGKNITKIIPNGLANVPVYGKPKALSEDPAMQLGPGVEVVGKRKDGSDFFVEITLSSLEGSDGGLVTAAIRDVTARKANDRHLVQMEARYRGLLEAAPDGMVVVDGDSGIVLLNRQAERQFGYRRDELLGQQIETIIPKGFAERLVADDRRTAAEALAQQIETGVELHGRKKDGTDFPIEIMLSPVESEEAVLVTAAIRDMTERQQLTRQLQQSQKMDAVGQLTGGIAHDFNNLLTVVIGNLALLELELSTNQGALKKLRTAQTAAARGADVTRRLLVFSRNDGLTPTLVPLGDSIQNMIEMAYRSLGSNIAITTRVDESVPQVFVDQAGFESALLNLLVNARDAMPDGGAIVVSSQRSNLGENHPSVQAGELKAGSYVCVGVTDSGKGMSQATLERACEPFFTTKSRDKGTGLGLAMVYGFAKQSGGIVRIQSELGRGTTVSLYLPIPLAPLHPAALKPPASVSSSLSGRVLVVDDDPDIVEIAVAYLKELGMDPIQAIDGNAAFKMILQDPDIELMITNLDMPGQLNGAELVKRTRAVRPAMKIIYSSGLRPGTQEAKAFPMLDGPMLYKPYQRAAFSDIVRQVIDSGPRQAGNGQKAPLRRMAPQEAAHTVTSKQVVLVVDDEADVGEFVCATSQAMGFECVITKDAAAFLKELRPEITLILLDLMMPGLDGIELLRALGERNCKVEIVLMSSVGKRTMESAVQLARALGLTVVGQLHKPFKQAELGKILEAVPMSEAVPIADRSVPFAIQKEHLQEAIARDEFVVYYQPQISIATSQAIGVEALVRWRHPKRGLIYPDRFISRMENFGLVDELGWIVANHGMQEFCQFANGKGRPLTLSLNASVNSLCDLRFPDTLVSIARTHGMSLANITIEVREVGLIKDLAGAIDTLTRLRIEKVKLSIDDFGTGYAMMQQFKLIPATELKIDKSFIKDMMDNNRDRILVQKAVEMGHELGMQVIAEGVETQEQLDFLALNGCDGAQGYLFSQPIPAKEMAAWLKKHGGKPFRRFHDAR